MPDSETLSHTTWDGKYHVVFIPKYRRKALYHEWRRHLGEVFRALAEQKEWTDRWHAGRSQPAGVTRAARACLPRIDTTSGGSYARQGTVSATSQARSSG